MREFLHHDRLDDMAAELAPLASQVKDRNPYWITGPHGDLGGDWCADCAYYVLRNRCRHDRKNRKDYHRDGGWRVETDGPKFCGGCGVPISVSLTEYGALEELDAFLECGVAPGRSWDAYALANMLEALSVTYDTAEARRAAEEAGDLAEAFLWSCV